MPHSTPGFTLMLNFNVVVLEMEHMEVVSLDGAMRVESHRVIDLHKKEKEAVCVCVCALCVHICVYTCTFGTLCAISDII